MLKFWIVAMLSMLIHIQNRNVFHNYENLAMCSQVHRCHSSKLLVRLMFWLCPGETSLASRVPDPSLLRSYEFFYYASWCWETGREKLYIICQADSTSTWTVLWLGKLLSLNAAFHPDLSSPAPCPTHSCNSTMPCHLHYTGQWNYLEITCMYLRATRIF